MFPPSFPRAGRSLSDSVAGPHTARLGRISAGLPEARPIRRLAPPPRRSVAPACLRNRLKAFILVLPGRRLYCQSAGLLMGARGRATAPADGCRHSCLLSVGFRGLASLRAASRGPAVVMFLVPSLSRPLLPASH